MPARLLSIPERTLPDLSTLNWLVDPIFKSHSLLPAPDAVFVMLRKIAASTTPVVFQVSDMLRSGTVFDPATVAPAILNMPGGPGVPAPAPPLLKVNCAIPPAPVVLPATALPPPPPVQSKELPFPPVPEVAPPLPPGLELI